MRESSKSNTEIIRAFIDWQIRRKHAVYLPSEDRVYRMADGELIDFLKSKRVREVYLEGASRKRLYDLLDAGFRVFTLRRRNQREERKKRNIKKSDEDDAKLLYEIWRGDPKAFGEYHVRALDALVPGDPTVNDEKLRRYRKVARKLADLKQELREWPDDEDLMRRIKRLSREKWRLARELNEKYGKLLAEFSDIKGFSGPTLLLWLAEAPALQEFSNLREFLVYLGLRAVYERNKHFNKKARQYLWLLAQQVRKCQPERKEGESIWQTMRWLAAEAWGRLRAQSRFG